MFRQLLIPTLFFLLFLGACQAEPVTISPTTGPVQSAATAVPSPPVPTATPPTTQTAEIDLFTFYPQVITVTAGTTITWFNNDAIQHSVTSGVSGEADGRFDTGFFYQNETASLTFDEAGTYPFFCRRHPHMQGTVVVLPAGTTLPKVGRNPQTP